MGIKNIDTLINHGNKTGRAHAVEIINAGLEWVDPYIGVKDLVSRKGNTIVFDGISYELPNDPRSGRIEYNLDNYDRVIIIGAAKGVQRAAKALEEILDEFLTAGHVIGKHGDERICKKIGVTLAGHPIPDKYSVEGCRAIYDLIKDCGERDLVITITGSGVSSLLTWPIEGVTLEEIQDITRTLQIEKGAYTSDLNAVRNHLDRFKGGRISRFFKGATVINLITMDLGGGGNLAPGLRVSYNQTVERNIFIPTLADGTTFQEAVTVLKKYDVWETTPQHIREYFLKADPEDETVKIDEYEKLNARVFKLTPKLKTVYPAMYKKAQELGYTPFMLGENIGAEAKEAALVMSGIALNVQNMKEPVKPPCMLLSSGELVVTVGETGGIGGRNQEFCTAAALKIAGSEKIVFVAVDTDGTDGPGGLSLPGVPSCLAGAVVDGFTVKEAKDAGLDIHESLKEHNLSELLWKIDCGIAADQNISVLDLRVILIME